MIFETNSTNKMYELSLKSARAKSKSIYIYEKYSLREIVGEDKVKKIQDTFIKNSIKIHQLTNIYKLPAFSNDNIYINTCMFFRFIEKDLFSGEYEMLIFDSTVAFYNKEKICVLEDEALASMQKKFFLSLWDLGQTPKINFEYTPNHSFYNSLDYCFGDKQIIVWPDADAITSYKGYTDIQLKKYIVDCLSDKIFKDAQYFICFIWNFNGEKMIDVWYFTGNHVDDRSGPLSEVVIFKEGKPVKDLGIGSGNTLLVLGYEEKQRRQSRCLKEYLDGPVPQLPLEICNRKNFFEYNI